MDREERDDALARIGDATVGLAPDDRLTDAVMEAITSRGPRGDVLAEIAGATAEMDADIALTDAVMARVRDARHAPSWMDGVARSAPIVLVAAALAAAASLALFLSSAGDLDATAVSSVDPVEVFE